jgi:hypothetical protein
MGRTDGTQAEIPPVFQVGRLKNRIGAFHADHGADRQARPVVGRGGCPTTPMFVEAGGSGDDAQLAAAFHQPVIGQLRVACSIRALARRVVQVTARIALLAFVPRARTGQKRDHAHRDPCVAHLGQRHGAATAEGLVVHRRLGLVHLGKR